MKRIIQRSTASALDSAMCGMMNALQWRRRREVCTRDEFENYLSTCEGIEREIFYSADPITGFTRTDTTWEWVTPHPSGFAENDRVRTLYFPTEAGPSAPTVLILHALMSASDIGYRRVAKWFNLRGWNVVFPHLPFHYTRTPRKYFNGELAITANLVRNAETLRQGVKELRQLMGTLRSEGCREFGILGTSYGGWTGALLSFVEPDFRFISLIQPIVNVHHAIWMNPGAAEMRRQLRAQGIFEGGIERHGHLSSPLDGIPLSREAEILIVGGKYDTVARSHDLRELTQRWKGARFMEAPQGHFGYRALEMTLEELGEILPKPGILV